MRRVRIVGTEFAGQTATVVQDQSHAFDLHQPPRGRVYVLLDGTDNPVPFDARELEDS